MAAMPLQDTFWHAAEAVLRATHRCLTPGAVTAWNVKDFVRNKAIVPFTESWHLLLERTGYEVFLLARASLVKVTQEAGLFEASVWTEKARKSFFRRLAEKKGSPRIDHETVIFARRIA